MVLGFANLHPSSLTAPLRRPPLLLAGSFLVAAGAIATNALFLQSRPHPAPLVITRDAGEPAATAQRSDDLVLAVQSALRRIGYYFGPLDGVAGPQTEEAILAFEAASGRTSTGEASLGLLAALKAVKADDATSLAELAAGEDEAPNPDHRVAAVQHALAISAYGPLSMDGILGPETREAIVQFQQDHGLPPTGEVSDALIVELRASGALQDR
jgi:peptidoglycan hydrolase-like protein with peptidoglycan-binding domain